VVITEIENLNSQCVVYSHRLEGWWIDGVLGCWSIGVLEYWKNPQSWKYLLLITPSLHCSITP